MAIDSETDFSSRAPESTIQKVAAAIRANHIDTHVVDTGAEARTLALSMIPEGAEVHTAKSKTLEDIGLLQELSESGRYDWLRTRYMSLDRGTHAREIRKLISAPDYMVGSAQAVTEGGDLIIVSASSSQLGPYAVGAGRLILVIGSQKIVRDFDAAMRRIENHVFPYEDALVYERMKIHTFVGKVLIIRREWVEGRVGVILVREPVGV
jgi:hypothetical protein